MRGQGQVTTQIFRDLSEINFLLIAIVVVAAWVISLAVDRWVPWLGNRVGGRARRVLLPLTPVLRILIIAIVAAQIISEVITPSTENLVAIFGAAGVAVGFGAKDYVSGILAGIVILYERPYRVGDWVDINGTYGQVHSIGLRSVKLRSLDDDMVYLPHSVVWTDRISNANDGQQAHQCSVDFYLDPDHDPVTAMQTLRDVARTCAYADLAKAAIVTCNDRLGVSHYRLKAYPMVSAQQVVFANDLSTRGRIALAGAGIRPAAFGLGAELDVDPSGAG